jgi:hypothetical protein
MSAEHLTRPEPPAPDTVIRRTCVCCGALFLIYPGEQAAGRRRGRSRLRDRCSSCLAARNLARETPR